MTIILKKDDNAEIVRLTAQDLREDLEKTESAKSKLIKPIVSKVFAALNQIFWLMNNKIGIYDKIHGQLMQKHMELL